MGVSGFCVFIILTPALRLFVQLKLYRIIPVLILISIATQPGAGKAMAWKSIGLRAGMNDNRNNENFKQYEGFATWSLPWVWHPSLNWKIRTYLEANAVVLGGGGESAFVGSIGPGIYYDHLNTPSACGGVSTRKRGLGGNYVSPQ